MAVRIAAADDKPEVLVVAEPLLTKVFADTPVQLVAEMSGRELEHTRYSRPFDLVDIPLYNSDGWV